MIPSELAVPRGDENLVQVVDEDGAVVSESENIVGEERISQLQPDADGFSVRTVAGIEKGEGPYRVVARRVHTANGTYTVYVARSLQGVARSTDNLERLLWWSLPALLTLMGILTWVVTGRALRPVEAIRREVEVIGGGDLHRRVPEPTSEDEIGRLARMIEPSRAIQLGATTAEHEKIGRPPPPLRLGTEAGDVVRTDRALEAVKHEQPRRAVWRVETGNVDEITVGRLPSLPARSELGRTPEKLSPERLTMWARYPPRRGVGILAGPTT
jgi:HAMP domain-containing protein